MFHQTEMGELDLIVIFDEVFIKPSRRAIDVEHADVVSLVVQRCGELIVAQPQAVDPLPACADLPIKISIKGQGNFRRPHDGGLDIDRHR